MIVKRGNKYCVTNKAGTKTLGCHSNRAKAVKQLQAVEVSKKKTKEIVSFGPFIPNLFEEFVEEDSMVKLVYPSSCPLEPSYPLYTPSSHLAWAVLTRAIRDYYSTDRLIQRDARKWFSENAPNGPWSFNWICDVLDLPREETRGKVYSCLPTMVALKPKNIRIKPLERET